MSYSKNDGKMKEGHKHTDRSGQTWIVKNQKIIQTEYDPNAVRI